MGRRLPIICDSDATLEDQDPIDPVPLAARGTAGYPGWLADRQGRSLRYLRLSVTDRCDLRCVYCMPVDGVPASAKEDVLSFEEIVRLARVFRGLGVETLRFTGGEPLVRRNLADLIRMVRDEVGLTDLALTTNATALAPLARSLVQAGLQRINISLDAVDPALFAQMTRGGQLERVIAGIDAIVEAGIAEVKLNVVVVRGMNDHHAPAVVEWAWARGLVPRFIELMPLGAAAHLGRDAVVPTAELRQRLAHLLADDPLAHRGDRGPAGYVSARGDPSRKVGFIGAVTDNFCHRCNRVRITARGELRACLASPSGASLRDLLRTAQDDQVLSKAVEQSLFGKGDGHGFYQPGVDRHHQVDMSRIGG